MASLRGVAGFGREVRYLSPRQGLHLCPAQELKVEQKRAFNPTRNMHARRRAVHVRAPVKERQRLLQDRQPQSLPL